MSNGQVIYTFLLVGALAGVSTYAQELNRPDQRFVKTAAEGGMAEVKLGHLAQEKGASQTVKDFGARMVADHSKANDELKGIASSKNVSLPDSLSTKDQTLYDRLSKLSGPQFDREYIHAMVRDHEQDVAEFRRESQSASDPAIKDFASKTLPTLEEHLKLAREDNAKVGSSAAR